MKPNLILLSLLTTPFTRFFPNVQLLPMKWKFQTQTVFTLMKLSLKRKIPTERRPMIRGSIVKHKLTKQILETITAQYLPAEEQRLESPERLHFFGKDAAEIFSCHKHLLSGVTLRNSFAGSNLEFALIYDGDAKNYKITLSQANVYVGTTILSVQVFTAIEKTLTKTPALYSYTEVLL